MERLQHVLFQLDDAHRQLDAGSLPALRVALLLLDNTAEILLDGWVTDDLDHDYMYEVIQQRARSAGVPETHPSFSDIFSQKFLSVAQKKQLSRSFEDKIRYVTRTKKQIPEPIGTVLLRLHRYRNEAYHSSRIRPKTLRTSVTILFSLCCTITELLRPSTWTISSSSDYSWLEKRFGLKYPTSFWDESVLGPILVSLQEGLPLDAGGLCEVLAENLEGRVEDLDEQLDFICSETRIAKSKDDALSLAQSHTLEQLKASLAYHGTLIKVDGPVSAAEIEGLRLAPDKIRHAANAIDGFELYAEPDTALDRLEFMVGTLVTAVDWAIQSEIDRARGK